MLLFTLRGRDTRVCCLRRTIDARKVINLGLVKINSVLTYEHNCHIIKLNDKNANNTDVF